jgi:hypothetical protein
MFLRTLVLPHALFFLHLGDDGQEFFFDCRIERCKLMLG